MCPTPDRCTGRADGHAKSLLPQHTRSPQPTAFIAPSLSHSRQTIPSTTLSLCSAPLVEALGLPKILRAGPRALRYPIRGLLRDGTAWLRSGCAEGGRARAQRVFRAADGTRRGVVRSTLDARGAPARCVLRSEALQGAAPAHINLDLWIWRSSFASSHTHTPTGT